MWLVCMLLEQLERDVFTGVVRTLAASVNRALTTAAAAHGTMCTARAATATVSLNVRAASPNAAHSNTATNAACGAALPQAAAALVGFRPSASACGWPRLLKLTQLTQNGENFGCTMYGPALSCKQPLLRAHPSVPTPTICSPRQHRRDGSPLEALQPHALVNNAIFLRSPHVTVLVMLLLCCRTPLWHWHIWHRNGGRRQAI
mmetsp:Transcript_70671/g.117391  ORF Transcript_70671/g.117391 Transcript_70671/m.117391 type:complete len:203 (+) Transcript_70671:187-795(+)